MKAPICRLCGKAHWLTDPHVWGVEVPVAPPVLVERSVELVEKDALLGDVEWELIDRVARVINEVANKRFNAYSVDREVSLGLAREAIAVVREDMSSKAKFDRAAYQREYMRRKRAAKKGVVDER